MKRILVLAILALAVFTSVFASDDYFSCSNLIDKKLDEQTISLIQRHAVNLSNAEKAQLYESNKSSAGLPFALNFFVGCGVGSFVQGDTTAGAIFLADEVLCAYLSVNALAHIIGADTQETVDRYSMQLTISSLAILASRVAECVRPFIYSSNYNRRLSRAVYGAPTVAVMPFFNEKGEASVAMTARIPLN